MRESFETDLMVPPHLVQETGKGLIKDKVKETEDNEVVRTKATEDSILKMFILKKEKEPKVPPKEGGE